MKKNLLPPPAFFKTLHVQRSAFNKGKRFSPFFAAIFSVCLMASSFSVKAGSGIFDSYVVYNGSFYDLQSATALPDFSAQTFSVVSGGTFTLGGQIKTFKNGSDNICGGKIWYKIYLATELPGAANTFTVATILNFDTNLPNAGDQQWTTNPGGTITVPTLTGNYKIAVYVTDYGSASGGGCGTDPFHTSSNSGNYWIANLTVTCPGAAPSITLGTSPTVVYGTASANLPFSAVGNGANQYSIAWDGTATSAGFSAVGLTNLAAAPSNIAITTSGINASGSAYNGTLTVKNTATGCSSSGTSFTVTITPKALTAASTATKVYNGSTAAGAVTVGAVTGYVGIETLSITGTMTNTYGSSSVGNSYNANISYSLANGTNGGVATNYSMAVLTGSGNGSITAKALTAASTATKVYDGSTSAGTVTVGTVTGYVGIETLSITGTMTNTYGSSSVGNSYNANISYSLANGTNGGVATNYSMAVLTGSGNGSITAKALTAASTATKVYDGNTSAGTVTVGTVTGLVNTETLVITGTMTNTYSSANVGNSYNATISYSLANGTNGGVATNYSMANLVGTGNASITAKALTAASTATKVYDGNTSAGTVTVGTVTGLVNTETLVITGTMTNTYSSANVGNSYDATISYSLSNGNNGGVATNYSMANLVGTGNASITALSEATADFRTKASGDFSNFGAVWEYNQGGGSYANASQAPTNTNNVSILHAITLDQDFTNGALKSFNIDAGSLTIAATKTLTIAGSADFNSNPVTVKSTNAGTGAIGNISGSLADASNVTVERYLPINTTSGRTGKAWRLLTAPVTGTSVNAAWQGGSTWNGTGSSGANNGYATLITGGLAQSAQATANANGFDWWLAIASSASSIRTHSGTGTGAWLTPANTTSLNFVNNQGYLLYVRGDRSVSSGAANATTLRATGTLKQGPFTPAIIPNGTSTFTLIGNPYASPINFETIYQNNSTKILPRFTIFDANLGLSGGYYLVERVNATSYNITPKPSGSAVSSATAQFIQSSQAIFVEASTNTANTLSIAETDKATGGNASVFLQNGGGSIDQSVAKGRTAGASLNINLNIKNADNSILLADGAVVRISAAYNKSVTSEDATKTNNIAENLAIGVDNYNLISERRPAIGKTDTVFLKLWGTGIKNYQLEITGTNLKGRTASLIDSYLGTATALNLDGSSNIINFSISSDAASKAINRFYIVTPGSAVTALRTGTLNEQSATTNAGAVSMKAYPNPATGKMVSVLITNIAKGNYTLSAFSSKGQQLFTRTIQHTGGDLTQDIALNNWAAGVYSLQLIDANSAIVKTTSIIVGQ